MGDISRVTYSQRYLWRVRYRTAAAAAELCYVGCGDVLYSDSCGRTATAAAVAAPFQGAALAAIAYSSSQKLHRLLLIGFRRLSVTRQVNRQHSATFSSVHGACGAHALNLLASSLILLPPIKQVCDRPGRRHNSPLCVYIYCEPSRPSSRYYYCRRHHK